MKYKITYTKRFEKHLKKLSAIEKKQIKPKVELLADNPLHPSLRTNAFKEQTICSNAALIWISELFGVMREMS